MSHFRSQFVSLGLGDLTPVTKFRVDCDCLRHFILRLHELHEFKVFDLGFNLFPVVTEHVMAHTTVADLQFLLCMHFALV